MNVSEKGRKFLELKEGCVLQAYQDGGGIWTIGYGHTRGVHPGDTITVAQADDLLTVDLRWVEEAIANNVKVDLTQNQYDALASFIYNVGVGNFMNSTLLRMLNQGEYSGAAEQFPRWVHDVTGQAEPGLVTRRNEERATFLS